MPLLSGDAPGDDRNTKLETTKLRNEHRAVGGHCLFRAFVFHGQRLRAPRGRHGEIHRIGPAREEINPCDPSRERGRVQQGVQPSEILMTRQGGQAGSEGENCASTVRMSRDSHVLEGRE